jgi:peptidoglycan/LPS O-acetylase OafA/YrhL
MSQPGSWGETEFVQEAGNPLWYLFYVGNFRDALGHPPTYVFGPTWSLAIEEQFYLTIPFLVAYASRRTLWTVFGSLLVAAPLIRLASTILWPDLVRFQYVATPSRVDVLALGCLMALYYRSELPKPSARTLAVATLALLAAMVVCYASGGLDRGDPDGWFARILGFSLIGFFFTAVVMWTLEHRDAAITAPLRFRPLCYLGKICYGLYLLHRPSEVLLSRVFPRLGIDPVADAEVAFAMKLAFAVAVSSASWYLFEKQVLRLKRRFSSTHHPGAKSRISPSAG